MGGGFYEVGGSSSRGTEIGAAGATEEGRETPAPHSSMHAHARTPRRANTRKGAREGGLACPSKPVLVEPEPAGPAHTAIKESEAKSWIGPLTDKLGATLQLTRQQFDTARCQTRPAAGPARPWTAPRCGRHGSRSCPSRNAARPLLNSRVRMDRRAQRAPSLRSRMPPPDSRAADDGEDSRPGPLTHTRTVEAPPQIGPCGSEPAERLTPAPRAGVRRQDAAPMWARAAPPSSDTQLAQPRQCMY